MDFCKKKVVFVSLKSDLSKNKNSYGIEYEYTMN